ncbi:hypothetical protein Tco_1406406 [Tanacetum coccineum]
MDDDLFSYEVKVANILCDSNKDDDSEKRVSHEADDDTGYDPSDVAFTEWLGSKKINYKTMDHYTKKALWIYYIRGDDEVELTNEESSDNEDEVAEVFRVDTNIFNFETPMCKTFKEFNYLLQIDPDLLTKDTKEFNTYEEYKDDWIHEWKRDIPWELNEKALRNKAIMEGLISDDESNNDGWKRWESHEITYHDHDELEYENETHDERQELYEYEDLEKTSNDAYRAYQEIFRMMDEGWMDLVKEISMNIGGEFTNMEILKCWSLGTSRRLFNTNSCSINLHGESTKQISVIMEYLVNISKRQAFWSLNEDILKITVLTTNTSYPSRKIQRIYATTHQRPGKTQYQYAVSRKGNTPYLSYMGIKYSRRYQTWSLLQETPIRRIQHLGYAVSTPTPNPINTKLKNEF